MKYTLLYLIIFCLILFPLCSESAFSQDILEKEVSINLVDASPIDLLRLLSQNYRISAGVETITYIGAKKGNEFLPINIRCMKCPVSKVLDSLLSIDNRYIWSYTEGVINVVPKDPDDRVTDTHIKELQIYRKDTEEIKSFLLELPEIKESLKQRSLIPLVFMSSGIIGARGTEISLSQSNTTLIRALNEIIKKRGTRYWSINKSITQTGRLILTL